MADDKNKKNQQNKIGIAVNSKDALEYSRTIKNSVINNSADDLNKSISSYSPKQEKSVTQTVSTMSARDKNGNKQ